MKRLEPESTKLAQRIRPVHVHHQTADLHMAWKRLDETYGAPEAVEQDLLKKVDGIP